MSPERFVKGESERTIPCLLDFLVSGNPATYCGLCSRVLQFQIKPIRKPSRTRE